ncbi:hypothetical protein [Agromyces sp. Marseille-Q5079]|uniref:hypothetical protein n=1 Tax=Agromyces sp. Marseille-Q5079 TaxID=3439059 RepID=UPI003D9CB63C
MHAHPIATARSRRSRTTIALVGALGSFALLALSGCTAASGRQSQASDWTSAVGARWDRFVDGTMAPLTDTGLAILLSWLGLAVAARVMTLLPPVRNLRMSRAAGRRLRIAGWGLVVLTPIVTVLVTATARDALLAWLLTAGILGVTAVCTLAPGLATRSRLDAHVFAPDGSMNGAWSIDALLQVRDVNADDPRQRVERQNSPDFGEFITIADRSGNGLASAIAWLVQVLFNSSPWLLQVTMIDQHAAIATLRRNGLPLDEVQLELDLPSVETDQHRKLLALAAAFTAMTMAERYPDVLGFYGARNWQSVGYLGIAQMAADAHERDHYLDRAVELEPRSLLVEYYRVHLDFEEAHDRRSLERLMDRLEPVVNQAAWVCHEELVFDVAPLDWHEYELPKATATPVSEDPEQPRTMLLRTLMLYSFAARNWVAQVELDHAADEKTAMRRARILATIERLVTTLDAETAARMALTLRQSMARAVRTSLSRDSERATRLWNADERRRRDPVGILMRMRARAALCYVIFGVDTPASTVVAAADPVPMPRADAVGPTLARPARRTVKTRPPGSAPARQPVEIVVPWLEETKSSPEIEIRYSYACYLARRAGTAEVGEPREAIVKETIRRVEAARLVEQYRGMAGWDPELKLIGAEPRMRELVLRPISSPWEITRFTDVRQALAAQGILEPDGLTAASALEALLEATEMRGDDFGLLMDAASILRAIEATDAGSLDDAQRLRAARYLIDDAAYSVRCLLVRAEKQPREVAAALAEAVFWVPTAPESEQVTQFLDGLVERLAEERAASDREQGAGRPVDARRRPQVARTSVRR